ncbi:MAG: hypothetical protein WC939_02640 [Acholeplasmataceae bacterium]
MAFDKLHKDIKEVCQIDKVRGTCLLWLERDEVRITVDRKFSDVVFLNYSGKDDVGGEEIIEGHIIESILSSDVMTVRYGVYRAYCPADRQYVDSVGFYVAADGLPDMPLGPTEEYAKIVGHELVYPFKSEV